jgi:hypothetical protein
VSIEPDAQKDLALDAEDAENVMGGQKKKKKVAHKAKHSVAGQNVKVSFTPDPSSITTATEGDDCEDPGYPGSASSDAAS